VLLLFGLITVHWLNGRGLSSRLFFLGLAMLKFQLVLPLVFHSSSEKTVFALSAGFFLRDRTACGASVRGSWAGQGLVNYPAYLWRLNEKGLGSGNLSQRDAKPLRGLVQGWTDPLSPLAELDVITGILALALLLWAASQWRTEEPRPSRILCRRCGYRFSWRRCWLDTTNSGMT